VTSPRIRLCLLLAALTPLATANCFELETVLDAPLPRDLSRAQDVRFVDEDSVLLSAGAAGVRRVSWDGKGRVSVSALRSTVEGCLAVYASRLAWAGGALVVSAPFYELAWTGLERDASCGKAHDNGEFNFVADVDTDGSRILLIGARREPGNDLLCPDGAIAWFLDLKSGLRERRPVYALAPGAPAMNRCGMFELSVVRFLRDGSFVVVPGVEDGVRLYAKDGSVLHTWSAIEIGFDAECELSQREVELYSSDFEFRHLAWINARRIVDDVVPMEGGFGLVIRHVTASGPSWNLVRVWRDGRWSEPQPLPLGRDEDPLAHVRADSLGNRLALLVLQYSRRGEAVPRLVVLEVAP
jgi:hypothetical protein